MPPNEQRTLRAGLLTLRSSQQGATCVLGLAGELDLANAATLEVELEQALADGNAEVVVDMSALTFIDSTGIALLVMALGRDGTPVRFVPSRAAAVKRVLELTGVADRLPLAEHPDGVFDGTR